MNYYEDSPEELKIDTQEFLASRYGKHIISTLEDTANGYLTKAGSVEIDHPDRYAAKFSAFKEILELITSPLDDDTPTRG